VGTSCYQKVREFKSPIRVVAAFLFRSRESQLAITARLEEELDEIKSERDASERQLQQKQKETDALKQQVRELKKNLAKRNAV
jgi:septal ring factor EnvC (AmiA/AmiB activator)